MDNQLLIISISLYIISIIAALILGITGKKFPSKFLTIFSYAHISFAIAIIILSLLTYQNTLSHYLILLFFCSGLIFSGIIIRKLNNKLFRLYFAFFPLTLILFIHSPTRFFKTVYTGDFSNLKSNPIALSNNYFLEKQDLFGETENGFNYKIYRKKGIISETVAGIFTEEEVDSVQVLLIEPQDTLVMRLYNAFKESTDIAVSLKSEKRNKIVRSN
ncbi:MAG: hypothetical protein ACR2GN_01405 [Bacteroidia bacterium]